jgi:protein involved in polysaccharide export with SLBB domain
MVIRAGGLSQFAYPKGASLIRRTVYYEGMTEGRMIERMMKEIKDNLDPKKNRSQNEAESILFQRLNEKLDEIEENRENEKKEGKSNFEMDSEIDSLNSNATFFQNRGKEQDMIGIDLEYILKNPGSDADLILFEGDILKIPKQLQTVRMIGEVLLPTTARYLDSKGFRSYISKAGGFTEEARRSKSYVIYANGDAKRTHSFLGLNFYPNLEPGAEIVVPKKPQKEKLSAAAWLGIASTVATLGILINTVVNQTP